MKRPANNFDGSIGKIEVDPKEEVSVVEVFQDVLDKLSDVGFNFKILISFQTGFHTYSALKILLKCHFHFSGQT
jgi:hypothetical protein